VHLPLPHQETQTFEPAALAIQGVTGPLPDGLAPERAVFLGSTAIALQAVHDAQIKVGDHVIVFGLGVLGLLAVSLARKAGASRITAVDPVAKRREWAEALGAHQMLDPHSVDVGLALKQAGGGADVAIEFSGSYTALQQAVRSVCMGGLVVAAGFYQGEARGLNLGEEWLHNRITMVASMRCLKALYARKNSSPTAFLSGRRKRLMH
jgi:threonine dehydrogenase-like Zn-dependent dehydrogenase